MGIENIKEVLLFVCKLTDGFVKSLADGKFNFADALNFYPAAQSFPAAIKDIKQLPAEYKDMDAGEKAQLVAYVQDEFDIPDDKIEEYIERAFALALDLAGFVEYSIETF